MVGIIAVVLVAFLVVIAGIMFWRRRRSAGKFEKCVCGASAYMSTATMQCRSMACSGKRSSSCMPTWGVMK